MISYVTKKDVINHSEDGFRCHREYSGLASDEKPIEDVKNGDIFIEMDTQAVFVFDEEGQQWLEQ